MRSLVFRITLFISLALFTQKIQAQNIDNKKPFVLGVIDEIPSAILGETRTLNIYLPEGYNQNDTINYPVIYLLDGSADEDFIHVAGIIQFDNFSWINLFPKPILVGIANVDRRRDFTYPTTVEKDKKQSPTSGKSGNFIAFIEKELQPYIERTYHTTSSKTIIGQSLGGLLATEILLKKPTLFNKYIIISPSLWWDNFSLHKQNSEILNSSFTTTTDVYFGVGNEGLAPTETPHEMIAEVKMIVKKLKASKSKALTVYYDYLPNEDHATIGHQAVFNAFRMLYSPKKYYK